MDLALRLSFMVWVWVWETHLHGEYTDEPIGNNPMHVLLDESLILNMMLWFAYSELYYNTSFYR
jgi:hypothetical protein